MHYLTSFPKLLIILLTFTLSIYSSQTLASSGANHIIFMDAGSTGTRLLLYKYEFPGINENELPQIKVVQKVETTPGISHQQFIDNPDAIIPYLDKLFQGINSSLSKAQKNETPIYLYATGGVRALPEYQQRTLINNVRNALVDIVLGFGYSLPVEITENVKVIAGTDEGLYNWLALNYLNGTLQEIPITANDTHPALDLGGESAQLTFLTDKKPTNNIVNFSINNITYSLYSYSYQDYGLNVTLDKAVQNYSEVGSELASCFPPGSQYPLTKPIIKQGTGNFDQCATTLQDSIYAPIKYKNCVFNNKTCSQTGIYQPVITNPISYGVSNYYYTLKILGLSDTPVTIQQIQQQGAKFCATPWTELKANYPDISENYLIKHCFAAAWIKTLLTNYNYTENQKIIGVESINGEDVSWTMGAAIFVLTQ